MLLISLFNIQNFHPQAKIPLGPQAILMYSFYSCLMFHPSDLNNEKKKPLYILMYYLKIFDLVIIIFFPCVIIP